MRRRGWGSVTGIDIDAETLAAARKIYPEVTFTVSDAGRISEQWQSSFDLVYLFNSEPNRNKFFRVMARSGTTIL